MLPRLQFLSHYLRRAGIFAAWMSIVLFAGSPSLFGDVTEEQKGYLRLAFDSVKNAGQLYQAQEFEKAGSELTVALKALGDGLKDADQDTYEKSKSIIDRIERAHSMLQLEGVVLPPFERPEFGRNWKVYATTDSKVSIFAAVVTPGTPGRTELMAAGENPDSAASLRPDRRSRARRGQAEEEKRAEPTGISFVNQVAPLLVAKCGGCHVQRNAGELSLESYTTIMKGPAAGVIVFAGDPVGSRLVEVIESGDMPRGGGKVSAAELQLLKDWVTQGAKFDGPNPAIGIGLLAANASGSLASSAEDMDPAKNASVPAANGPMTVSFSKQVAPLIVENCSGCHLEAMQLRGNLNMETMARFIRGGDSGPAFEVGNGEGSLIVRKLRGQEGQRMPAGGRPPLSDDSIALVSKWIEEGARLDSGTEDQPLRIMVLEAWVANATADEVTERREEMARKNWQLGAPENARGNASESSNDQFLVLGNVRPEEAERIATAAAIALEKAKAGLPGGRSDDKNDESVFKGKITIFAFSRRYDYAEFSKMVEQREIPQSWNVHWHHDRVDAYLSLTLAPNEDVKQLTPRLLAPIASLMIAEKGAAPRWFREGLGRMVASRTGGREFELDSYWDSMLRQAVLVVKNPKEVVDGKLPPEQADLIGYGLAKSLLDRRYVRQTETLLQTLQTGTGFDDAFAASFGMPVESFVAACFGVAPKK